MDSFVRIYSLYRSITRWRIAVEIYQRAAAKWKFCLWGGKAVFAFSAVAQFFFAPWEGYFFCLLTSACLWAWSFDRSRRSAFANFYHLYPERMKYFEKDYQYIRYLHFREKLQNGRYSGSVEDALSFLNEQIDTDSQTPISSHSIITFLIASAMAILGGAAGKWQTKYIVATLLALMVSLYFVSAVLGVLQTRQADLKEFKRFLMWARDEQPEN